MQIFVEELMLFFCIFEFLIARSKEVLQRRHARGRPLACAQDDECVSNEISRVLNSGGALLKKLGGRATSKKKKVYDCTMGFQGEDVATDSSAIIRYTNLS